MIDRLRARLLEAYEVILLVEMGEYLARVIVAGELRGHLGRHLLRVLRRERLNVTELTGILGLAQSGVSRHLGLLKDAGLVILGLWLFTMLVIMPLTDAASLLST